MFVCVNSVLEMLYIIDVQSIFPNRAAQHACKQKLVNVEMCAFNDLLCWVWNTCYGAAAI